MSCHLTPSRSPITLMVLLHLLVAAAAIGQEPIEVYLHKHTNVGVGFDELPATTTTVEVRLISTGGYKIVLRTVPEPQSSRVEEKTGTILWHRSLDGTPVGDYHHVWNGVGVIRSYGMAVRFYAELEKGTEGDAGDDDVVASRGSVADLSIDMDTKGVHEGKHWPPDGCQVEDELKLDPGMQLPASLITGVFPLQVPDGAEYKLMDVSLRTAWGGHFEGSKAPAPSVYGTVELKIDGPGVAVYEPHGVFWGQHDTSQFTRTKQVTKSTYDKVPLRVLTNEQFDGERVIQMKFTWDPNLFGGTLGQPYDKAVATIRLVPYETERRILGPKHVPGLSKYRYRLEMAPGETRDPDKPMTWTVTTEDSEHQLATLSDPTNPENVGDPKNGLQLHGLEVDVTYKNTSPAWIALKATFTMNEQSHSVEQRVALVRVELGAPTFTWDNTMLSHNIHAHPDGTPPPGLEPTFVMKHEPGYDWMAFKTNLIRNPRRDHMQVVSGAGPNPAMAFNTPITLKAPEPEPKTPPAHHHIEVGYVQMVSVDGRDTERDTAHYLTKDGHGVRRWIYPDGVVFPSHESLDWPYFYGIGARWPWYSYTVGVGDAATLPPVDVVLQDSPAHGVPMYFNEWDMEDPNRDAPLVKIEGVQFFKVRVAARTTDTELNAHTKVFALTDEREWSITFERDLLGPRGVIRAPKEQGQWKAPATPYDLGGQAAARAVHSVPATIASNRYGQPELEWMPVPD